jgi:hypothetical protein
MPHPLVPFARIKKPPEAISNGLAGMQIVVVRFGRPVGFGAVIEFHRH